MLSAELSTGLLAVSLLCSLVAVGIAWVAMQYALTNKRHDRDFRSVLLAIQELEDDHAALSASHKKLRSRVGMQDLRARRKTEHNEVERDPDTADLFTAETDKEKWKKEMRIKLHRGELKP